MQTSLSALLPGQSGTVTNVGGAAGIRHRLLEMGLTVGTAVQLVRTAPFGGPIELDPGGPAASAEGGWDSQVLNVFVRGGN